MRRLLVFLTLALISSEIKSQILHAESFSVIIDTTKTIKGVIVPDFKFQNLREDLLEIENVSDITFRFDQSAITFANKIELSKFGKTTLLSGGFIYLEYRRILENRLVIEPYVQMQWAEARGLELKYASGANLRWRVRVTEKMGLYLGTGPFYEFERWNYNGVKEEFLPTITSTIKNRNVKLGTYASFKWLTGARINLDVSLYHQSRFDSIFSRPRLASSASIKYLFTEHLGLILQYQNIYDNRPVVPVASLFNKVVFSINVSF